MNVGAILLAAGSSQRFGGDKLASPLGGKPVWKWAFDALADHPSIASTGIVAPAHLVESMRAAAPGATFVVAGGDTRTASAQRGLASLPEDVDTVLIHDAARPFLSQGLISEVIEAVGSSQAACPALPVTDTIKRYAKGRLETLDRSELVAVQTPQAAKRELLEAAYALNAQGTDDMSLIEALGVTPQFVPGDPRNMKITLPEDYSAAVDRISNAEVRTGLGYDVHAFSEDPSRPLLLGGVRFAGHKGLEGHSDADVLLHAVVDALLGSAAMGDIGVHFPNTDPAWKDAPSGRFLQAAREMLRQNGWEILNVDATVIAESPKVMVQREEICRNIAEALRMEPERVSVKATTNEQLGSIGRGEGISAFAVATVRRLG